MYCFHQRFDVGLATLPRRPNPGLNDEKILSKFDTSDQQEYGFRCGLLVVEGINRASIRVIAPCGRK